MRPQATAQKFFALAGMGFLMTLLTVFMGAPFFRVIQKAFKSWHFWLFGLSMTVILVATNAAAFAVAFLSIWILIGLYGELEKQGQGWKIAGFTSVLASTITALVGMVLVFKNYDINSWDRYVLFVSEILDNAKRFNPELNIDPAKMALQTPSIVASPLLLILGAALIFEKWAARLFGVMTEKVASQIRLLEFRLPDSVIWVFLLSFFFSVVDVGIEWLPVVGGNLVNLGAILFFFQGLAVLEVFMKAMKMNIILKALMYIIMMSYLSILLVGLGLIDYWVDFRSRLRRMQTAEIN